MGKYAGCLTSVQVGKREAKKADKIMRKYGVLPHERCEIKSMIAEGYFQLSQSFDFQKQFYKFLKEKYGIDADSPEITKDFIKWNMEQIGKNWSNPVKTPFKQSFKGLFNIHFQVRGGNQIEERRTDSARNNRGNGGENPVAP